MYEPPLEQFNSTGLTMETFVSKVHVKQPVSVLSLVCEREQTGQLFFFCFFLSARRNTHTHITLCWASVNGTLSLLPAGCCHSVPRLCPMTVCCSPEAAVFKKPRHVAAVLTYYRHQNHGGLFKENLKKASF